MANQIPIAVADFETQLSTSIAASGTSFSISSATDDDGNSLPAGKYCFTVDNGKSNKEYLLGQLNGTDVTSVVRVSRQGVETSGAEHAHRIGSSIIVTDFATIQRVADILRGSVDLDGTAPIGYDAEPTLSDREDLATVGYVLDTVTGGTVAFDSQIITGTAGEAIAAGDLVYFKTSDQEWYQTDADTAATVNGVQLGIAQGSGTDGAGITGGVQISGTYTTTGLTAGSAYYAGNTAGAYTTSAGTTNRVIGVALSTTKLLMIPVTPESVTSDEKDAMVGGGDLGSPSSTNKYLTEQTRTRILTAGATINGGTLPVPVYQNKTDNEFYACDGNDTDAMKFLGFATSNSTDGNDMDVQFTGIVNGFTGLSEGEKYYLSDTVGTISSTIGTYEVLVGVAISETELLIQKGKRRSAGTIDMDVTENGSEVITCGFRPSVIRLKGFSESGTAANEMNAVWSNGSLKAICFDATGSVDTNARLYDGSNYLTFSITSVTDTSFTINWAETGSYTVDTAQLLWEAEGEL